MVVELNSDSHPTVVWQELVDKIQLDDFDEWPVLHYFRFTNPEEKLLL